MRSKEKAVAAGMRDFRDGVVEKFCRTCHNERSPFHTEFKFEEMWAKIAHPVPKP